MADYVIFENEVFIEPGGYSKVKYLPSGNIFIDTGTMIIMAPSSGGVPFNASDLDKNKRINIFTDPQTARDVLRKGDLLDAVLIAFDPVNDPNLIGARRVIAIRVNQAERGDTTLECITSGSTLDVTAKDYGKHTNQIAIEVIKSAHPNYPDISGAIVTLYKDGDEQSSPFLCLPLVEIEYTGVDVDIVFRYESNSQTMTIESPADTVIHTIDLLEHETVGQVVDFIDAIPDYSAKILGDPSFPSNLLDDTYVGSSASPIPLAPDAPRRIAGTFEEQIQWLSIVSKYTIAAQGDVERTPLDDAAKVFLTGATETSPVTQDWIDSIEIAALIEGFYQIELSGDIAIAQINKSSVKFNNNVAQRKERIGGSGEGDWEGTTPAQRTEDARSLNSFLYNYCVSPMERVDSQANTKVFEPKFQIVASMAINSGNGPATASTFKSLTGSGNPEEPHDVGVVNEYIRSGCQVITHDDKNIPRIVRSVTTFQGSDLIPSEMSMVATALAMAKIFRITMEKAFVGKNITKNNQGLIESKANEILDDFVEAGFLTSSETQDPYKITDIRIKGDTVNFVMDLTETPVLNFIFSLMNIDTLKA